MQRIDYRKVLEDNGAGKIKVEVQQVLASTFCLQSNMLGVISLHVHGASLLNAMSWHMQSQQLCLGFTLSVLKRVIHCRLGNGSFWASLGSLQQPYMSTKTKELEG